MTPSPCLRCMPSQQGRGSEWFECCIFCVAQPQVRWARTPQDLLLVGFLSRRFPLVCRCMLPVCDHLTLTLLFTGVQAPASCRGWCVWAFRPRTHTSMYCLGTVHRRRHAGSEEMGEEVEPPSKRRVGMHILGLICLQISSVSLAAAAGNAVFNVQGVACMAVHAPTSDEFLYIESCMCMLLGPTHCFTDDSICAVLCSALSVVMRKT